MYCNAFSYFLIKKPVPWNYTREIYGHQNNPLIIAHDHGINSSEVTKGEPNTVPWSAWDFWFSFQEGSDMVDFNIATAKLPGPNTP